MIRRVTVGSLTIFAQLACGHVARDFANANDAGAGSGGTGGSTYGEDAGKGNPDETGGGGAANSGGGGAANSGGGGAANSGGGGAASVCGNGLLEALEGCDDRNNAAGDGCSPTCTVETGFACGGAPSACNRSCNGSSKTCGPNGNRDCCASSVVTGVTGATFFRSYDGVTTGYTTKNAPALVSDFRLDDYEITVGRFRKFVAAYSQTMITQGAGKNANNLTDPGWDATDWNASLETNASSLKAAIKCDPTYGTWSDVAGSADAESLPMNCISWFDAEAFCIWDGGRLPTEAEWNYAAAGGIEQRVYPWGATPPDANAKLAIYSCFYPTGMMSCAGVSNIAPVGSIVAGNGKFGQADLAGNVEEWVQDWFLSPYGLSCNNCANLTDFSNRSVRGGDWFEDAKHLLASARFFNTPDYRYVSLGARCARSR